MTVFPSVDPTIPPDPTPSDSSSPTPTPTVTVSPEPSPTPTVTETATVTATPTPQASCGVSTDQPCFTAPAGFDPISSGTWLALGLVLMLLAGIFAAQLRRP